jgi:hypothetical protein
MGPMWRSLSALGLLLLAGCGKPPPPVPAPRPGAFRPLEAALRLRIVAAPDFGPSFQVLWTRESLTQRGNVRSGETAVLRWREELSHPWEWKLKFGPTAHPAYRLVVAREGGTPPTDGSEPGALHDPRRVLAVAYFAVPQGGERDLEIVLREPDPLQVGVWEADGRPAAKVQVVGIPTPRFLFLDGFGPEDVDDMQLASRWTYFNFDPEPHAPDLSGRWMRRETDGEGRCRFEGFVGWVGISQRSELFAMPRSRLVMGEDRSVEFRVVRPAAKLRLEARGLPGPDFHFRERGFWAEGLWRAPPGTEPRVWREKFPFVDGDATEFSTPCDSLTLSPLSRVHRIRAGAVVDGLRPGERRTHAVELEPLPHHEVRGEVLFEDGLSKGREHCSVELYREGPSARLLDMDMPRGGSGVPAGGRVPFALRTLDEGPYVVAVRTASYPTEVVRGIRAPRKDLQIRLARRSAGQVQVPLRVFSPDGRELADFVAGSWPQRGLVDAFTSGSRAMAPPGKTAFVVLADEGVGVLRDVEVAAGGPAHEVRLVPGVEATGRLLDAAGKPAAGIWIHAAWPGLLWMPSAHRWLAARSEPDGSFRLRRLPPGAWRLFVHPSGDRVGEVFEAPAEGGPVDLGDVRLPTP